MSYVKYLKAFPKILLLTNHSLIIVSFCTFQITTADIESADEKDGSDKKKKRQKEKAKKSRGRKKRKRRRKKGGLTTTDDEEESDSEVV